MTVPGTTHNRFCRVAFNDPIHQQLFGNMGTYMALHKYGGDGRQGPLKRR